MTLPPRKRNGGQATLTEMQRIELWAWHKAKKHLGTQQQKAREMGVPLYTVKQALRNLMRRDRQ